MGFGFLSLAVLFLFFAGYAPVTRRENGVGTGVPFGTIALVLGSVCAIIAALFGFGVLT
jgi:hypothetical protein